MQKGSMIIIVAMLFVFAALSSCKINESSSKPDNAQILVTQTIPNSSTTPETKFTLTSTPTPNVALKPVTTNMPFHPIEEIRDSVIYNGSSLIGYIFMSSDYEDDSSCICKESVELKLNGDVAILTGCSKIDNGSELNISPESSFSIQFDFDIQPDGIILNNPLVVYGNLPDEYKMLKDENIKLSFIEFDEQKKYKYGSSSSTIYPDCFTNDNLSVSVGIKLYTDSQNNEYFLALSEICSELRGRFPCNFMSHNGSQLMDIYVWGDRGSGVSNNYVIGFNDNLGNRHIRNIDTEFGNHILDSQSGFIRIEISDMIESDVEYTEYGYKLNETKTGFDAVSIKEHLY